MKTSYFNKFYFIVIFTLQFSFCTFGHAEELLKLKGALNKGKIKNTSATILTSNNSNSPHANLIHTSKPQKNQSKIGDQLLPYTLKPIKIVVNKQPKTVLIPFYRDINHDGHRKNKSLNNKCSLNKLVAIRIGENNPTPTLLAPSSFGFPINPNDTKRIEGEKNLEELYSLALKLTPENYYEMNTKIFTLSFDIIANFSQYPDICAISYYYAHGAHSTLYFGNNTNNSFTTNLMKQILLDYQHQKNNYSSLNILFKSINSLLVAIDKNSEPYLARIKQSYIDLEKANNNLEKFKTYIYQNNSEINKQDYVKGIATYHDMILDNYYHIYVNYLTIGDFDSASKIFSFKNDNGSLKIEGEAINAYNSVPYYSEFKYYDNNQSGSSKIIKENIKQYKNSESILNFLSAHNIHNSNDFGRNDQFDNEGNNITQQNNYMLCNYLSKFEPQTSGNEAENKAEERIFKEKLEEFKKNAYGYNNYYINKPSFENIFFSRIDKKLSIADMSRPTDYLFLNGELDFNKPLGISYSIMATVESCVSKLKKTIIFKRDNLRGGYYAKFQPNVSVLPDNPPPTLPPLSNPAAISVAVKTENTKTLKLTEAENIIQTNDDLISGKSIACFNSEILMKSLLGLYRYCHLFKNPIGSQNIAGYSLRMFNDDINSPLDEYGNVKSLNDHNAKIVDEKISQICKDFLKFGGGENILITFKTNLDIPGNLQVPDWFPAKIVPIYHYVKNQADWFIVYAHGWHSNNSGGIVEDGKFRVAITPRELIDEQTGKSEYAEDMEVLILFCCDCLRWIGDYDGSEHDFDFTRGWHKVLPRGVILGYSKTITTRIAEETVKKIKPLLDGINTSDFDKLVEIWRKVNEESYEEFLNEPIDLNNETQREEHQNRLNGSASATVIYGDKYIDFEPRKSFNVDKISVKFVYKPVKYLMNVE